MLTVDTSLFKKKKNLFRIYKYKFRCRMLYFKQIPANFKHFLKHSNTLDSFFFKFIYSFLKI